MHTYRHAAFALIIASCFPSTDEQHATPIARTRADTTRAPDSIDRFIEAQMQLRRIPGVSLAIITNGRMSDVRSYGTTELGGTTRVSPTTLFQTASVSKPVAAFGILRLVQNGTASLDEDVNRKLSSWKVPDNEFTVRERVTLRRLLSHTAGINVHGIPGYPAGTPLPSLVDAINGRGNTPPLRVMFVPGSRMQYSGGGYSIAQLLVQDVTRREFADYMWDTVLRPMGMKNSTFAEPLPDSLAARAAIGHDTQRTQIPGRWYDRAQVSAGGLWSTPSDMARFLIELRDAHAGRSQLLTASLAREMLKPVSPHYALGLSIDGSGDSLRFYHGGLNVGYESYITMNPSTGDGAVLFTNIADGGTFLLRVMNHLAATFKWRSYPTRFADSVRAEPLSSTLLNAVVGDYEVEANQRLSLRNHQGRLMTFRANLPDEEFVLDASGHFQSLDRNAFFKPLRDSPDKVTALEWTDRGVTRRIRRMAI